MQPTQPRRTSTRTKAALWLMIGPTALLIGTFMLFALVNWVFGPAPTPMTDEGQLFADGSTNNTIANVLLFLAGTVAVITWLPGLIVGIVLLSTRK